MPERCAICKSTERLVRDHDHATGEVRGWLCSRCNVMLGYAADSPERLASAVAYLATTSRGPRAAVGEPTPAKRDRAAYMRDYRRRNRAEERLDLAHPNTPYETIALMAANERIAELEAEVARLKRELSARPTERPFNSRPFTPVPKK